MHYKTGKGGYSWLSSYEWQKLLTKIGAKLIVPLVIGMGLLLIPKVQAADNWQVEGAHGVLHVRGALTESACRLDMASAWQEIFLGVVGTGRLRKQGDHGTSVALQFKLQDCLSVPSRSVDSRSGAMQWSENQPSVSISFSAIRDIDNPQLVKVQGAGGLGLRLTDVLGRDVRLGSRGAPLLLEPGGNELTFNIIPERTRAPLLPGTFRAQVNLGLSYD